MTEHNEFGDPIVFAAEFQDAQHNINLLRSQQVDALRNWRPQFPAFTRKQRLLRWLQRRWNAIATTYGRMFHRRAYNAGFRAGIGHGHLIIERRIETEYKYPYAIPKRVKKCMQPVHGSMWDS